MRGGKDWAEPAWRSIRGIFSGSSGVASWPTFDDRCLGIAKGAAYSALLSFFPVLDLRRRHPGADARGARIPHHPESPVEIVPPGSVDLVVEQFRTTGARPISHC